MGKVRYFMVSYVNMQDNIRRDGRAIMPVRSALNIENIEKRIKENIEGNACIICTGFYEMSEEDYLSNFLDSK